LLKRITPTQVRELREQIGEGRVLTLKSDRAIYSYDLGHIPVYLKNLLFHSMPGCVIQPSSEEELIEIIKFCRAKGVRMITRAAASSGFGNVIPTDGEVVIDLSFLRQVVDFDPSVPSITVQSGTRWADVDAFLHEKGLALYTYPSSYYSSVGGWVATGGLGINSLRFGHLKNHVLSMRIVFPTGEARDVLPSNPWFSRFFGTEGQLGSITQVCLKVRPRPKQTFPLALSFREEQEAFQWMSRVMAGKTNCNHIKFMGPDLVTEINRFYGGPLIEPRPSVLAVFEDTEDRDNLEASPGEKAPEYLARFLWHERLFPLRMSQVGASFLASETLFEDGAVAPYVEEIRRMAGRLGFDLLVEAHAIETHRLLLMPHFLCDPKRPVHYLLALGLTSLLTKLAVDHGGVPYGVGIWNSPFIRDKYDVKSLNDLRRWKDQIDPDHLFNPSRYFHVETRLLNLPGLGFRPWIFRLLMKGLVVTSPIWAWVTRSLNSSRSIPTKVLTPVERAASLCSRCGSCLSVCPAYRVTRDEALTPRSKLRLIQKLSERQVLSCEEAQKVFLCLHCRACEGTCQSRLSLVEAWKDLEERMARDYGTPGEAVDKFIKNVDESEEYERMVDHW